MIGLMPAGARPPFHRRDATWKVKLGSRCWKLLEDSTGFRV
jgi:hypothetical protein